MSGMFGDGLGLAGMMGSISAYWDSLVLQIYAWLGWNTRDPIDSNISLMTMSAADALLKVQPRASVNCYSDGGELAKGINELFWAMFHDRDNIYSQDEFNFEDATLIFFRKCNVFDTLPSTLIVNGSLYLLN